MTAKRPPRLIAPFNDNGDSFFGHQFQRCESYSNFFEDDAKDLISDPIPFSGFDDDFSEEIPVHHHGSSKPALPEGYGEYWDPFLMTESNERLTGRRSVLGLVVIVGSQ